MSATRRDSIVITEVLAHLHRGWSIIPLGARGKRPLIPWERYQSNYPTAADVRGWWRKHPDANVGVVTGAISKLVVLDVDPASGGNESLKALEQEHGKLPKTVCVRTGGGGTHFYFQHPGTPVQNSAGKLGHGLDVRGDGGYVVAPPAVHENGTQYRWDDLGPDDIGPAPLPGWLLELMIEVDTPNDAASDQQRIPEGQRNARLTSLGGAMRCRGLSEEAITAALLAENKAHCKPPLRAQEVREIAAGVARYKPDPTATAEHLTDLGNARRLVASHGDDLRYCAPWHTWLVWDGRRWAKGETGEVERRAKRTIQDLYLAAATSANLGGRQNLATHAVASEARGRIEAMIRLAQTEPRIAVTPGQLVAERVDTFEGAIFIDPLDGAEVRWNPVWRRVEKLPVFHNQLIVSVPTRPANEAGDYPIDREELGRKIAPCLTHMMDAYFSSLVMERLVAHGVRDFVAIHDSWIVPTFVPALKPSKVLADDWEQERLDKQDRSGAALLRAAIKHVGKEWLSGLGPVYDRLLHYLEDTEYGADVRRWKAQWEQRIHEARWPEFVALPPEREVLTSTDAVHPVKMRF